MRRNNEELSSVITRSWLIERGDKPQQVKHIIREVFMKVEEELGLEKSFEDLIPIELWKKKVIEMNPTQKFILK